MYKNEEGYLQLMKDILLEGEDTKDRTGVGTRRVFCPQVVYDISGDKWPVFTTKKIHLLSVIHELIWFLSGDTNTKYLTDNGVRIWNEWADEFGDLGPVYGYQWRKFPRIVDTGMSMDYEGSVDQIVEIERMLNHNPSSRRIILSAWNPGMLEDMALPPCHCFVQWFVSEGNVLSCMLYQRSADMFLGVPFNVASYSLMTHMLAKVHGLKTGKLYHNMGDAHIYSNHFEQVKEQVSRSVYEAPSIYLDCKDVYSITDFKAENVALINYKHHPLIKGVVAV